jgi:glutathione S-transferase
MPKAHQVFNELARLLASKPYFAGDTFSLADIMVGSQLDMLPELPEWQPLTAAHPNLIAWLNRVARRPSFVATTWERVVAMAQAA